jgi:hypothetical protein
VSESPDGDGRLGVEGLRALLAGGPARGAGAVVRLVEDAVAARAADDVALLAVGARTG